MSAVPNTLKSKRNMHVRTDDCSGAVQKVQLSNWINFHQLQHEYFIFTITSFELTMQKKRPKYSPKEKKKKFDIIFLSLSGC